MLIVIIIIIKNITMIRALWLVCCRAPCFYFYIMHIEATSSLVLFSICLVFCVITFIMKRQLLLHQAAIPQCKCDWATQCSSKITHTMTYYMTINRLLFIIIIVIITVIKIIMTLMITEMTMIMWMTSMKKKKSNNKHTTIIIRS